jgi:hypothetical protein
MRLSPLPLILCLCLLPSVTFAGTDLYSELLRLHVVDGRVQYEAIAKDARFAKVIATLEATDVDKLKGAAVKAFWINAYNAFTIKAVIDAWPVRSIRDIAGGQVWELKNIKVDGKVYSLNDIEHKILRPMGDPRIHFALVCAARSCPPLRSEAYTASDLERQLDEQGRVFLRDQRLNAFDVASRKARLSQIFEWFGSDFGSTTAAFLQRIAPYTDPTTASSLKGASARWTVSYIPYDWSINGK